MRPSQWLSWLHAHAIADQLDAYIVLAKPNSEGFWKSKCFHLVDVDDVDELIESAPDWYVRGQLIDETIPSNRRGTKDQTGFVTHFGADVDYKGGKHADESKLPTREAALKLIAEVTPKPSAVLESGGGFYVFWRLTEPFHVGDEHARRRFENIGDRIDYMIRKGEYEGLDSVAGELARVLRPSGALNGKYEPPRRVELVDYNDHRDVTLEQLENTLPQLPYVEPPRQPTRTAGSGHSYADVFASRFTLDEVLAADPVDRWHYVARRGKFDIWHREASANETSLKYDNETGVTLIMSGSAQTRLGVTMNEGLTLYRLACLLAGANEHDPRNTPGQLGAMLTDAANQRNQNKKKQTDDYVASIPEKGEADLPQPIDGEPSVSADLHYPIDGEPSAKVPATRFPVEVWERPTLRHIRQAAQARQISPHALLFHVLARVAAYTPPSYTIPPYRAYAPFSLYVAHIGRSGSGKSITAKTADELIGPPPPGTRSLSLGTGEGFVESFFRKITETDDKKNKTTTKRQDWHGVLFKLDEGSKLWRILERSGQTGVERLRTAWLGDAEGDANSTTETSRNLEANSYAVGIVFLFQPENLRPIFDDTHGGLPQRFLFCRGGDAHAPDPDKLPDFPGPLNWQPLPIIRINDQLGKHPLTFPPEVAEDLRPKIQKQLKREEGVDIGEPDEPQPDPLDEHRNVHRMKIAGLLALLENRKDVTVEDWELADTLLAYSDTVRNGYVADYQAEKTRQTKAADRKAAERAVTVEATVQAHARDVAVGAVARKVSRQHPKPVARRELQQAIAGKYRQHVTLDDVIDAAIVAGLIIKTGEGEFIKGNKK